VEFVSTHIPDVVIIKPRVFADSRGYFMESYRRDLFTANIGKTDFIQDNESRSSYGVLRGLHYQLPPWSQNKLIRVVTGRVLDVAVDIRKSSPTFGRHIAVELSEDNKHQVFIPQGFAHGFVVLSSDAVISYKVDRPYAPKYERGIYYADLSINWQCLPSEIILSDKDKNLPCLKEAELFT